MREVTRAQKARLGIFLVVSGLALAGLLLMMTGSRIFEKRDIYNVRYRDMSVSGLEIGAQVKYHGVRVGRVEDIFIDPDEVETIVVSLSLKRGTPVKKDVKSVIAALSLTGLKIIELEGGSSEAPLLPPGSEIPAGESPLQMITGRAEAVSEKLELVLSNLISLTGGENQERLLNMVDNTSEVLVNVHGILQDNRKPIAKTITNLEIASQQILQIVNCEEITRVLANLDTTAADIRNAELGEAVKALFDAVDKIRTTFTHIDLTFLKGRHDLLTSIEVLRESLDSFNEFTRLISENPSLLLRGTQEKEISGGFR